MVCITHGSAILSSSLEATPFHLAHVEGGAFSDWSWLITPPMNQPPSLCSVAWFIGGYTKVTLRVSIDWQINRFYNSANGLLNRDYENIYFKYFFAKSLHHHHFPNSSRSCLIRKMLTFSLITPPHQCSARNTEKLSLEGDELQGFWKISTTKR